MKKIARLRTARHRDYGVAAGMQMPMPPRTTPYPNAFQPRHCAGALDPSLGCLHTHPGDQTCGCGQAVLPPDGSAIVLQLRPHDTRGTALAPFIRHSSEGCHQTTPVSA